MKLILKSFIFRLICVCALICVNMADAATPPDPAAYYINKIPANFIDIAASGNRLLLGDQEGIAGIPIGFNFEFYGAIYNTIGITSNGYLTFSTIISSQNTTFPHTQTPNSLIAPFWDYLNPRLNPEAAVYYETRETTFGRQFIVQWDQVPLVSDPGARLTFEAVLFETSNEIQFQYRSMQDSQGQGGTGAVSGGAATIGIENGDGTRGREVGFNRPGTVTGGSAFSFTVGRSGFLPGRQTGDFDLDRKITILDHAYLTDFLVEPTAPCSSAKLLGADIAPQAGIGGRPFGDGKIDVLDHEFLFQVIMGRAQLNPVLASSSLVKAEPGDYLLLSGSGFNPEAAANLVVFTAIGGNVFTAAASTVNAPGTELAVTVPGGMSFIIAVHVESFNLPSNSLDFLLENAPLITAIFPAGGQPGDAVTIRGYAFGPAAGDNAVQFNGAAATVTGTGVAGDYSELYVIVPAGVSTGPVTVTAGGNTSNGVLFTYDGPPVVALTAPAADSEITAPVNITGTVSDLKLAGYTLEYAQAGEAVYTVIAAGSAPVDNGVLGAFDPTMLLNGLYTVRLTATDADGHVSAVSTTYIVKGELKIGNFTVTFQDVAVPVAGIPITIDRTYDSRDKGSRDFGYGWSLDIRTTKVKENKTPGEGWVQTNSGGGFPTYYLNPAGQRYVTVTLPDGKMEEFDIKADPDSSWILPYQTRDFTLKFTARPGTTSTLRAAQSPLLMLAGSDILDMDTLELYDPDYYILTTQEGTEYMIDENLGLTGVRDSNNNSLTINANGIVHSSGSSIGFTRDAQGRITRITDPMAHTVDYSYNAAGDLASVTDQEGNATTFTYNSTHGLIDIVDPLGRRAVRNEYDASGRLTAHIDGDGQRIEFSHNTGTRQEVVKDRLGNITVYEYDNKGQVVSKTDSRGAVTAYTFDAYGNTISETDPLGNITTWTYDNKKNKLSETKTVNGQAVTTSWTYNAAGKLLTETDPRGNVKTNTYDTRGNKLTETDAMGNVTTYTYDARGNRLTTTDSLGNQVVKVYDAAGNATSRADQLGNITLVSYDKNGNKLTETDPLGNVTTYTYDAKGRQTSVLDPLGNLTKIEYDKVGNVSARVDAAGGRTVYSYSSTNKPSGTAYPDGTADAVSHDAEGNMVSTTDRSGKTTTMEYNKLNKVSRIVYPDGSSRSFEYDALGRETAAEDAAGNVTHKIYDSLGRVIKITDPEGNSMEYGYDLNGNRTMIRDANGNTTVITYNDNNQETARHLPGGLSLLIQYNSLGKKSMDVDAAGNTTQYGYDACGRLISVTDALNNITRYEYDANGSLTALVNAGGNRTVFTYDAANRMITKTNPLGAVESYAYNPNGKMSSKTDALDRTTSYVYDAENRLVKKTYPDNTAISFTYTATGKRSTVVDGQGTTSYTYDALGRITGITYPDNNTIQYSYDTTGHLASLTSMAGTIEYLYNSCCNRLLSVTGPGGNTTAYSYDPAGNRTGIDFPNGISGTYTYNANNRLTGIVYSNALDEVLASFGYTLGPAGNRTGIDETSGETGTVKEYTYDPLYRLTGENVTGTAPGAAYAALYTYDAAGNRLTAAGKNYTYNNADQLLTTDGIAYEYDLNGNLVKKTEGSAITTYTYDFENRLIRITTPAETITHMYDADGNRVQTITPGGTIRYLVDTNRELAQVLAEYTPAGELTASYVYADDLISMTRNGITHYFQADGLGSTRLLTDNNGTVTDTYDFTAFGNLTAHTGTTENPWLFTGQQYDANIGFYYLRARYYAPVEGRFSASDPFPGDLYTPVSLHKYLYANANPVNFTDPSGKFTLTSMMVTIAIRGTLAAYAYMSLSHLISIMYKPVEWNGDIYYGGWGAGLGFYSIFTSECRNGQMTRATYEMLAYGIVISPQAVIGTLAYSTATLETPGLFGISPLTLVGYFSWISASFSPYFLSDTQMVMGMGFGPASISAVYGLDIGVDLIAGLAWMVDYSYSTCN